MKHLSILVPQGQSNLSSIVGALKVFSKMNDYYVSAGREPIFAIDLAGACQSVQLFDGLFSIHPNKHFSEIHQTDLIIVPALKGDLALSVQQNKPLCAWILQRYRQGAELACLCTGAFLVASTGLLKGRSCSTHWMAAGLFHEMFPDVNLVADKLITEEQGIYTNGGGYSFLNLLLHLVEKYTDRKTAIYCSKLFQIEIERTSQSPFIIFSGQKGHEDDAIKEVQLFIEKNVDQKISVDSLAATFGIGKRNFDRRFKKATSNTPLEYIQRVKIEAAKKNLETGRKTVSEVMYSIGYSDTKAFRTTFKKITGLSPLEYRNKYNKAAVV